MGALASVVMSATTFAGSAQFAAVSVLSAAGSVGAAATAAVLLNARYVPIGISVASVLRGGPLRRFVEAQLVVDESWAFSRRRDGSFDRGLLIGAGLVLYTCWVLGTAAGASGGEATAAAAEHTRARHLATLHDWPARLRLVDEAKAR